DDPRLDNMIGEDNAPLAKPDTDAESIATIDGAPLLISFERRHRIWRNDTVGAAPQALPTPAALSKLPNNGGVEAMTFLCDGRLLIVAEKNETRDTHVQGWLQSGEGWETFTYKTTAGFRPTGAATLPNCNIIFIERSFSFLSGIAARVVIIDAAALRPSSAIEPVEIARFEDSLTIDNMEGISARRSDAGETLIYLISDDNYNPLQRTILMMFALTPP
ncbi:MAG: esterase-like activity of phytase family protein, partial [Alphaproteobacteria bacterium]|nr:esterase-like activity of phytase family protein [Alphaproteobacteria bacterium]